jgi:hypothetical protein
LIGMMSMLLAMTALVCTVWMLHIGNIARFQTNDRLNGEPPKPLTISHQHCTALHCLLAPAGGGREQLVQQLLQRYPQRFAVPRKLTDRKPAKGEKDTPELEFVKPDVLAKLTAQGQVVHSQADAATGSTSAVTADVLHELAAAGV